MKKKIYKLTLKNYNGDDDDGGKENDFETHSRII